MSIRCVSPSRPSSASAGRTCPRGHETSCSPSSGAGSEPDARGRNAPLRRWTKGSSESSKGAKNERGGAAGAGGGVAGGWGAFVGALRGRAQDGVDVQRGVLVLGAEDSVARGVYNGPNQGFLVVEIVIELAAAGRRACADVIEADRRYAALGNELGRGANDALACRSAPARRWGCDGHVQHPTRNGPDSPLVRRAGTRLDLTVHPVAAL